MSNPTPRGRTALDRDEKRKGGMKGKQHLYSSWELFVIILQKLSLFRDTDGRARENHLALSHTCSCQVHARIRQQE